MIDKKIYQIYLGSLHWQRVKLATWAHFGGFCFLCGSAESLQCHHLRYALMQEEIGKDVVLLCRDCHRMQHKK